MALKDLLKPRKILMVEVLQGRVGKRVDWFNIHYGKEEGVVTINKRQYYFLGFSERSFEEASNAKALSGAAVGSLFSPVFGSLVGGAVGARKNKKIAFLMAFRDVETNEDYTVEVTPYKKVNKLSQFDELTVHKLPTEEVAEEKTSVASELREFKALLDDGIISEDEFNKKKQALLG
ncbi:SHOCT domain-containing protein [Bacillus sp. JCM 19041]|uniref:SHOCT domain-containing protein n=1 Tax=Bacillus sp. JCM 19041 TaxID=1460637 RepID=UPI0006D04C38